MVGDTLWHLSPVYQGNFDVEVEENTKDKKGLTLVEVEFHLISCTFGRKSTDVLSAYTSIFRLCERALQSGQSLVWS